MITGAIKGPRNPYLYNTPTIAIANAINMKNIGLVNILIISLIATMYSIKYIKYGEPDVDTLLYKLKK
jgi:hypothetical protein